MYWLKPFDAVNDAANAMALSKFDWSEKPILEIGGGDGVFSFVLHGGEFKFLDDRYDQTDVSRQEDIYDVYKKGLTLKVKKIPPFQYDLGIDLKLNHLLKSRETMLYKHNNLISSKPEALPIKNNIFSTVFLYTFHGLTDYKEALREIRRVIKKDGKLLMIVVNKTVKDHFICYKIHKYCKKMGLNKMSDYFLKLDDGRFAEIGRKFAKSIQEWKTLCNEAGFQIEDIYTQVSPMLWRIYDTQTRPFLKVFIHLNYLLKRVCLKRIMKFLSVYLWLPVLGVFYFLLARPAKITIDNEPGGVFLAIRAKAI